MSDLPAGQPLRASLSDFHDGGPQGVRDLRVKLLLPAPGGTVPHLSNLSEGWYQRWLALPAQERGVLRTYTVRALRGAGADRQLDIDFVLHVDQHGHGGPASSWAAGARQGDCVTLLGPRATAEIYRGITWHPPRASEERPVQVLLAGDETAVPAISSVLEAMPEGCHGHALLEVPHPEDFQDLDTPADLEVVWLARGRLPHGDRLLQAVRTVRQQQAEVSLDWIALQPEEPSLWEVPEESPAEPPRLLAWTAGETSMVRRVRSVLADGLRVDRTLAAFMGYWRQGRAEAS